MLFCSFIVVAQRVVNNNDSRVHLLFVQSKTASQCIDFFHFIPNKWYELSKNRSNVGAFFEKDYLCRDNY